MHENEHYDCVDYSYFVKPSDGVNADKVFDDKLKHLDFSKKQQMKCILDKFLNVISGILCCSDKFQLKIVLKPDAKLLNRLHIE